MTSMHKLILSFLKPFMSHQIRVHHLLVLHREFRWINFVLILNYNEKKKN